MSDVVTGGTSQAGTPYQSTPAVTTVLGRDEFGNPTAIRGPNGYELSYLYDSITHAHVVSTTDVHGYVSTSSPNYLFGVPDAVTDINGHTVSYDFDQWGRLESVTGPMDQGTSVPTIVYQYALPLAAGQSSFAAAPLWAKTGHKDIFRNPASSTAANHDFVETVSFMDGHGRIIKTRKDLERDVDGLLEVGMTESGHITFENLGRPWKVAQPRFYSGPPTAFSTGPLNYQTVTTYDALDRVLSVTTPHDSPDGSVTSVTTTTRYTLEEDVDGALRMASVVTDPNGYAKTVLRDVDGSIVEVREVNDLPGATNETLVTSYDYNPVDELIQVADAGGNVTTSTYDTLGRMVALSSPDMGLTKWSYDLAGSVVAKETAQLRAKGQKVTYEYDIDQLIAIHYPDSEDKLFQYGQPSEAGDGFGNVAGRIKSESAEAGLRTLEYDRLGNVSRTNMQFHRIREPHFGDYIASVEYEYGPFGRLHKVRFPSVTNFVNGGQHTMSANAESVTYAYDAGGNLQSVFGQNTEVNPQHPGEMPHTDYVVHIGYDHFGQEVRHIAGNFAETIYEYQPGTRRLASISTDFRDDFMRQAGQPARAMQRVSYQYDLVGNITHVENQVPWANQPSGTVRVGTTVQDFTYDKLYQLRAATGRTQSNDDWRYRYFLEQEYDELGNITQKDQSSYREIKDNGIFRDDYEIREQSYVSTYYYDGPQPHTPSLIEERLPAESIDFPRAFTYDASGNQTKSVYRGSDTREIVWNEDDQIKKVIKNGQELNKTLYDAEGNKAVHLHHVSGLEETAYLGPNMTLRDGKYLTKHIYTGDQRVATKMDADWMQEPPTLYFHNDHLGSTNYSTNDNQPSPNTTSTSRLVSSGETRRTTATIWLVATCSRAKSST